MGFCIYYRSCLVGRIGYRGAHSHGWRSCGLLPCIACFKPASSVCQWTRASAFSSCIASPSDRVPAAGRGGSCNSQGPFCRCRLHPSPWPATQQSLSMLIKHGISRGCCQYFRILAAGSCTTFVLGAKYSCRFT
jgi:hypothetical protein